MVSKNKSIQKVMIWVFMITILLANINFSVTAASGYILEVDYSLSAFATGEVITYDGGSYHSIQLDDGKGNSFPIIPSKMVLKDASGNEQLTYCIEPLKQTTHHTAYDPLTTDELEVVLMSSDKQELQMISYFGYGYNGDVSNSTYLATQLAIWEYQGYQVSEVANEVLVKVAAIQAQVSNYKAQAKPSFAQENILIQGYGKANGTLLSDTNNVISNWYISGQGKNIKVEKQGNKVLVYAETKDLDKEMIYFQDIDPALSLTRGIDIIYTDANNADTQKLMKISGLDFSKTSISARLATGSIYVTKQEAGTNNALVGATLQIIDNQDGSVVDHWVSDGMAHSILNLPVGEYTLKEVTAPDGYVLADDVVFAITVDQQVLSIEMEDAITKVAIAKYIERGGKATTEFLAGATLQIIDPLTEQVVYEFVSSDKAELLEKTLVAGKTYRLQEKTAPVGYRKADSIEFTVAQTGDLQTIVMYDQQIVLAAKATAIKAGDSSGQGLYLFAMVGACWIILSIKRSKRDNA